VNPNVTHMYHQLCC